MEEPFCAQRPKLNASTTESLHTPRISHTALRERYFPAFSTLRIKFTIKFTTTVKVCQVFRSESYILKLFQLFSICNCSTKTCQDYFWSQHSNASLLLLQATRTNRTQLEGGQTELATGHTSIEKEDRITFGWTIVNRL